MLQELFRLPILDLPIHGYGVMVVLGFLAAVQLARFLARRAGMDPEFFINAGLVAIVSGVVGARISHVVENFSSFTRADRTVWENFFDAINISSGGLTFFGGLLLAVPVTMLYGLWHKVPIRRGLDVVAPCIMIALGIGRVGCFLNGCCYGAACEARWAVQYPYQSTPYVDHLDKGALAPPPAELYLTAASGEHRLLTRPEIDTVDRMYADLQRHDRSSVQAAWVGPDTPLEESSYRLALLDHASGMNQRLAPLARAQRSLPVHPTQLYSTFNALLIAAVLLAFLTVPHAAGRVFALMMILKGVTRFLLELLRTEPAVLGPMSLSMVIGLLLAAAGIALWLLLGRLASRDDQPRPVAGVWPFSVG